MNNVKKEPNLILVRDGRTVRHMTPRAYGALLQHEDAAHRRAAKLARKTVTRATRSHPRVRVLNGRTHGAQGARVRRSSTTSSRCSGGGGDDGPSSPSDDPAPTPLAPASDTLSRVSVPSFLSHFTGGA